MMQTMSAGKNYFLVSQIIKFHTILTSDSPRSHDTLFCCQEK